MKNRSADRIKFTEAQINFAIKQSETGVKVEEIWLAVRAERWGLAKLPFTTGIGRQRPTVAEAENVWRLRRIRIAQAPQI